MADPLLLGLYAYSALVKKKRDTETAKKALEAEQNATAADQAFELQKLAVEEAGKDRRANAETIAKNTQYYMYQNETNPSDIFTAPLIPGARHPQGYKILGTRSGGQTEFQAITDITGSGNTTGMPLFQYQGTVGTRSDLRKRHGPRVDLMNMTQVGTINKDGEYDIFSIEDTQVALGAQLERQIRVGNRTFPIGQEADAQTYGYEIGVRPKIEESYVLPNGKTIGGVKTSELGEARTTKSERFMLTIPAKGENSQQIISNLTRADVQRELNARGLREDQVTIDRLEIETGPNNTVVSEKTISRTTPADVTEKKTVYTARIGTVQHNNLTFSELENMANEQGYDLEDITYTPTTKTYKNGDLIETTVGETKNAAKQKRHIGYITDKNGVQHPVQAESKQTLTRLYGMLPGFEYAGLADVRMGSNSIVGAVEAEQTEDLLLTLESGEQVLSSQASGQQRATAVSQQAVKVGSDGTISRTGGASLTPTRTIAKDMNIGFRTKGNRFLGAPLSATPGDTLVVMSGKLDDDTIAELNGEDGGAGDYVSQAMPAIVQAISDIRASQASDREKAGLPPLRGHKSSLGFVRQNYPNFLKVEGMEEALKQSDTVQLNMKRDSLLQDIANASPTGSLPIVVQSASNPDTMDDENRIGNLANRGIDAIFAPTSVPPQYADFSANVLFPKLMALNGNRQDLADSSMFALLSLDRHWNGEPILVDNVISPSQNQPIIGAFKNFHDKKLTIGNTQMSYLDLFISYANGENVNLNEADYKYFANTLIPAANNLTDAVEAVEQFIYQHPANLDIFTYTPPSVQDAAMNNGLMGFGSSQTEQQFRADSQVIRSGTRGIGIANKILATYYDPETGNMRPSSSLGNVILSIDGLEYLSREAFDRFSGFLTGDDSDAIANSFMQNIDSLKQQLKLPVDGKGNEGREQIEAIIDDIAADVVAAGDDAELRALAARQFHIVTLAYELSATIQGGTGGRTISDQDVALILKALRQQFLASPESQVAVIEEARAMMQEIVTVAKFSRTQDPRTAAAFSIVQNLSAMSDVGSFHRNITPGEVARRIAGTRSVDMFDDQVILDSINIDRVLKGESPYTSVDQITPEDRAKFEGSIQ
jgi:hypothetical protein